MTPIYLIRHGRTAWNDAGRYQGQADPPLNALGERQAAEAAETLRHIPWAAIYASDLQRARQTAEALAARTQLAPRLDRRLREIHLGKWQGMLADDIKAGFAEEFQCWRSAPTRVRVPGGETVHELDARVCRVLDEYAAKFPGQPVAVFTHKLPMAVARCRKQARPLDELWQVLPENGTWDVVNWTPRPATANAC